MENQPRSGPAGNAEEITSDYANNVYFVGTVWDLKLLFGELASVGQNIDWHTSITMPWATAKLMAYYLQVNIAQHELSQGKIKIPAAMIPDIPPDVGNEDAETSRALAEIITTQRRLLLGE